MKIFRILLCWIAIALMTACGSSDDDGGDGQTNPPTVVDMRVVHISAYGEGNVSDASGVIACESHECEKSYVSGAQVVLTATPKVGWNFERWSGCDTVVDAKCTVTASSDRMVAPVFLRTVETKLQSNVRSMTSLDDAAILKYESGVISFAKTAPVLSDLKVGDILLSQSGVGLARRVMKIVSIPGGSTIVDTSDVAITDVVAQGSYYFNSKGGETVAAASTDRRASSFVALQPGVKPLAAWSGDLDVKKSIGVDIPIASKKSIKGSIDVTLNVEGGIDIVFPGVLQEFRFVVNPTIEPHLSLVGDFGKMEGGLDVARIMGAPIVLGPVVLVPEFVIKIAYEGKIEVEVNFASNFTTTGSAGFTYLKGHGARKVWTAAADAAPFLPAGTGSISLDLMGGLESGLKIWGVAGPKVEFGPYLSAEGSLTTIDGCAKLEAEIGVRGKVGGEIKIVSWDLGKWEWVIAELPLKKLIDKSLTSGCDKLPAAPSDISAAANGPNSIQLTWTPPPAAESVVAYEIYRQGRMVTRVSESGYIDTGLIPGNEYCYDVRSRDISNKVSSAGTPVCRSTSTVDSQAPTTPVISMAKADSTTSGSLSWVASSDNVDVARYVVLVNDTVVDSTSGTNLSVLRLTPNTDYCFKVRAYDAAGNRSADSAARCIRTLAPEFAGWTLKLKCVGQSSYVVSTRIDIDLQSPNNVSSAGSAQDYNGGSMSYHLFGGYDSVSGILSGRVDWTFANSSAVREDEFSVKLSTADTGDIAMQQIKVTGCDGAIRLVRN